MDTEVRSRRGKDIIVEELGVERDKLTSDASFMETWARTASTR